MIKSGDTIGEVRFTGHNGVLVPSLHMLPETFAELQCLHPERQLRVAQALLLSGQLELVVRGQLTHRSPPR